MTVPANSHQMCIRDRYLLRETGSSTLFGVVTACSFAPMVILSMVGGVLADRVNKRNIMVGLDFSTAAIIMLFYFSLGKIPTVPLFIVVLMLLYGAARHFISRMSHQHVTQRTFTGTVLSLSLIHI